MRFRVSRQTTRTRSAFSVLTLVVLLASCGIDNDAGPRSIPEADRPSQEISANQSTGASTGNDTIYLLAPVTSNEAQRLRPAQRSVGASATNRLQALFDGPLAVEAGNRLGTAIPADL